MRLKFNINMLSLHYSRSENTAFTFFVILTSFPFLQISELNGNAFNVLMLSV